LGKVYISPNLLPCCATFAASSAAPTDNRGGFGEWVKAELVMVMGPGSVKDGRMFSTLEYTRDPQHNKLQAQH